LSFELRSKDNIHYTRLRVRGLQPAAATMNRSRTTHLWFMPTSQTGIRSPSTNAWPRDSHSTTSPWLISTQPYNGGALYLLL